MKHLKIISLLLALLMIPVSAIAFLTDNDPEYFFDLVAQAPVVLTGKISQVQPPERGREYFVYQVQTEKVLAGDLPTKEIKVFQEKIFPSDQPVMAVDQVLLLFLAPMPRYTAYQKAVQEGARHRLYGGAAGVWSLDPGKNTLSLTEKILSAKSSGGISETERKQLNLLLLTSPESKIREAGAFGLAKTGLSAGALSSEEEQKIFQVLLGGFLSNKAQVALIQSLKDSQSIALLKKIANEIQGTSKWAAVRALKELGYPRTSQELAKDFERGNTEEKERAMGMMAQQGDAASQKFLSQVIQGSEDYEVKRATIVKMGEVGGTTNERVLIENINNPDEKVSAQILLSLGNMNSRSSVPEVIRLLQSESKLLRDAAILSLYRNKDPKAVKYFQDRYVKDAHGHFYPRHHFSEIPGVAPPDGSH